jgi:hypothetical protein
MFWSDAADRDDPPERTDLREPFHVEVAANLLTRGPGEWPWLRISVADEDYPEGCSVSVPPSVGLDLLAALQRWAGGEVVEDG